MDSAPPRIVRHRVLQLGGFLTPPEAERWMQYAFESEASFAPSGTIDNATHYRRSLVLNPGQAMSVPFTNKVRSVMPDVIRALHMRPFTVGIVECQLTANNDGAFFGDHTDAGRNDTVLRQLTYVYYFNRAPKGFEGGELRVYDDQIRNGKLARVETFQAIEPRHNSIVFFQAPVMHEVMPVRVPSREFRDSRFTVNGWIQRT